MVKNRVKECRLKANLSQVQLANLANVSQSTVAEVETGRHIPSLEVALLLSKALKTPMEQLFWLE